MKNLDYDELADAFFRHRRVNQLVIEEVLRKTALSSRSRVLEVGCGTASHLRALVKATDCQGWGIDPSTEMMRHALGGDACLIGGRAEALPLVSFFFDLVFSKDVIHYVKNTVQYFSEAFRVLRPNGHVCTVTDSEKHIRNRRPLSQYWPSTVKADLERYPRISTLRQHMVNAGFVDIKETERQVTFEITDPTPYREKAFSCLHLISEEEFQAGVRHLETDLRAGAILGTSEYVFIWGRRST